MASADWHGVHLDVGALACANLNAAACKGDHASIGNNQSIGWRERGSERGRVHQETVAQSHAGIVRRDRGENFWPRDKHGSAEIAVEVGE